MHSSQKYQQKSFSTCVKQNYFDCPVFIIMNIPKIKLNHHLRTKSIKQLVRFIIHKIFKLIYNKLLYNKNRILCILIKALSRDRRHFIFIRYIHFPLYIFMYSTSNYNRPRRYLCLCTDKIYSSIIQLNDLLAHNLKPFSSLRRR